MRKFPYPSSQTRSNHQGPTLTQGGHLAGNDGSVTLWIGDLKTGAAVDEAAYQLWGRYFDQIVRLARARLRSAPCGPADEEEDVALSVFYCFCQGAATGRFPDLSGRDDLWRLLVTITANKAADRIKHEHRQKRGGGRVVGEHLLNVNGPDDGAVDGLAQAVGREPNPEFAVMVADECCRLLDSLCDDVLRQIALLRMEGYENAEIAQRLGCGLRTVERKLDLIRKIWLAGEPS
jgi:DNA-directed RNA polymerase specialized sigma24 family protein